MTVVEARVELEVIERELAWHARLDEELGSETNPGPLLAEWVTQLGKRQQALRNYLDSVTWDTCPMRGCPVCGQPNVSHCFNCQKAGEVRWTERPGNTMLQLCAKCGGWS